MERLQSVQNVCECGSPRQTGAWSGLRGRNGVPIVPFVQNAIASRAADGIGLLHCFAHRACFPCYVERTSFRAATPSHHQRQRGLFHHRPARTWRTPVHAFPHTQDQQAVCLGELTRLAGSIMLCVLTIDVHVPRLGRSQTSAADCRRMMRSPISQPAPEKSRAGVIESRDAVRVSPENEQRTTSGIR